MKRLCFLMLAVVGCEGSSTTPSSQPDLSASPDLPSTMSGCGAEGAACSTGSGNGLCKGGVCSPCVDTTDDSACASAYSGTICTRGSCIAGCHDSSTCSGQVCDPDTSTCRACSQDADCPAAQFCDLATGKCGATMPACAPGVNGAECCADGDCSGGATCVSNACVNMTNCPSPAPKNQFYVDPDAKAGFAGVGSTQCPFKSINTALRTIPSPAPAAGFTVCTKGIFDMNNAKFPLFVHTNVELDGTYCSGGTTHTQLKVPAATTGVTFGQDGPASIHGFDILSSNPTGMKTYSGILVTGTGMADPVGISDVTINNFGHGIYVTKAMTSTKAGNAGIHHDSHINSNDDGLTIDSGGHATVSVNDPAKNDTHAEFNMNTHDGITVGDGSLDVIGEVFATGDNQRTVRANNNGNDGLKITSNKAVVSLKHFSASDGNAFYGLSTLNTATVSVRNSVFLNNMHNGIFIFDAANTTASVGSLDFGKDATTNAGNNLINGNTGAGICISTATVPPSPLLAAGNIFGSMKDCSMASAPANPVTVAEDCGRALDVAGLGGGSAVGTLVTVDNCKKLDCFNHKTTGGCPQ